MITRAILLIALFTGTVFATENARQLAEKANKSLEQGDFEAAIQQYELALTQSNDPRITYNKAIAHYRRGEIDTARGLFESIVGKSDQQLAAKARYNIGNAYYAEAVKFLDDKNPKVAISKLSSAIDEYRRALALDRKDRDARTNIELAYRLRKQLEQKEQQNEKQQQDQQDKDQDDQDQDDQDPDSDSDQQQDPDQQDPQQNQDQPSESDEQESPQDSQQDQSDEQEPSDQQQSDSSNDPSQQDKNSEQSKQDSQANESDEQDKESDSQSSTDEDQSSEKPPEGELEPINDQQDANADPKKMQQRDEKMTLEEARKMLQAIRDSNFRRRLDQRRRMQMRRIPVDKDW